MSTLGAVTTTTASSPPRFTVRVEGHRALLYDRVAHQYRRLSSSEAFLVLGALEVGSATARALLAERVGADAAAFAAGALASLGVLPDDDPVSGRVVELPPLPGAWAAPLVVHLGVTLACNFSCAHCYSSSGKRAPNELSGAEIFALVDEMATSGVMKLVLGGGEPFLRKDLARVVAHANTRGVDAYVHTNGSLVDEDSLHALAASPPAALAVSLDGADPRVNDRVRGPGAFARARAGLAALREHYAPGFHISFTVTPANADTVDDVVRLARDEGARLLLLRPAYPAGEALADPGLVCDRETFARAIDRAREVARDVGVALDAPHPAEQGEPDFDGFGCVAGRVVLGVSPTGDVTPCLNLDASFVSGNLRSRSLLALWRDGEAFTSLRAIEPNAQCATCRHYDTCRGGCRVRALHAGAGVDGPDAWCHYEPRDGVAPETHVARPGLRIVP